MRLAAASAAQPSSNPALLSVTMALNSCLTLAARADPSSAANVALK
jgi:hypothetical protein